MLIPGIDFSQRHVGDIAEESEKMRDSIATELRLLEVARFGVVRCALAGMIRRASHNSS